MKMSRKLSRINCQI